MSIIYEALKKVEGQKISPPSKSVPAGINLPIRKKEKKGGFGRKVFFLSLILLLVISVLLFLGLSLTGQEGIKVAWGGRAYKKPELESHAVEEIISKKEPTREYILEGIIYDQKAPSAIINGRVMKESDKLEIFRIDKISKDKVEMVNTEDNSKVILSLPY